jgi:hypothetical protein
MIVDQAFRYNIYEDFVSEELLQAITRSRMQ